MVPLLGRFGTIGGIEFQGVGPELLSSFGILPSMSKYTEVEWEADFKSQRGIPPYQEGSFFLRYGNGAACKNCGVIGFYAPRLEERKPPEVNRKYRVCKFCGKARECVGYAYDGGFEHHHGEEYNWIMIRCMKCATTQPCGSYTYKVPWNTGGQPCEICQSPCHDVVKWPKDDPDHPFHLVRIAIKNWLDASTRT